MALGETLDLTTLPAYPVAELPLWNWQAAFLPGAADWQAWLIRAAAQLLREPRITVAQLMRTTTGDSGGAPQVISLDASQTLRIGRALENDVVLPQATVTRQHAELRWRDGAPWLVDLGGGLGTVVNGAKAQPNSPVELTDGAEFVIFPYRFQLKLVREWVPVTQVAITQAQQAIRTRTEFAAGHSRGWIQFPLAVHAAAERICLAIEEPLLNALTDRMLAPLERFALPHSQRVWHELLVLGALAEANRSRIAIGHLTLCEDILSDADTRGIECRALIDVGGERGAISCFLPWPALAGLREIWTGSSEPNLAEQVMLPVAVSCGRVELSLREQGALEPGDVVLYEAAAAVLFPGSGRAGWTAEQINETQFAMKKKLDRRVHMTDATQPLTEIADLNLTVEILVGQKEMSIREAEALTPGAVIDLERGALDPVRLAVNGRVIGSGQLVNVSGRLGVRIVEWAGGAA